MGIDPAEIDDKEIADVISGMNRFEYLQTIFCCSGHPLWEDRNNGNPAYVEFCYGRPEGRQLAELIVQKARSRLPQSLVPNAEYFGVEELVAQYGADVSKVPKRILRAYPGVRICGTYEGPWDDDQCIRTCVETFWSVWREALQDFSKER